MFVCMHHGDSCRVDDRAVKLIVGEVSDDLYQQKKGALVDQVPGSFIYYRILLLLPILSILLLHLLSGCC